MAASEEHHQNRSFWGFDIIRNQQEHHIEKLMEKYKDHPVDEELKEKVWNELQMEKHEGRITIPFKLAIRRDTSGKFPDYLEVILDSKV